MKVILDAIRCKRNKDFVSSSKGRPFKKFELATRGFQNHLDEAATKAVTSIQKDMYPWDVYACKALEQTQQLLSDLSHSLPITDNVFEFAEVDILNQPDNTGLLKTAMKSIIYRSSYALHNICSDVTRLPPNVFIANVNITERSTIIEVEYTYRKRLVEYSKDVFKKVNFSFVNTHVDSLYTCASILNQLGTELSAHVKSFQGEFFVTRDDLYTIAEKDLNEKMRGFVNTLTTEQRDMLKGDFVRLLDLL